MNGSAPVAQRPGRFLRARLPAVGHCGWMGPYAEGVGPPKPRVRRPFAAEPWVAIQCARQPRKGLHLSHSSNRSDNMAQSLAQIYLHIVFGRASDKKPRHAVSLASERQRFKGVPPMTVERGWRGFLSLRDPAGASHAAGPPDPFARSLQGRCGPPVSDERERVATGPCCHRISTVI